MENTPVLGLPQRQPQRRRPRVALQVGTSVSTNPAASESLENPQQLGGPSVTETSKDNKEESNDIAKVDDKLEKLGIVEYRTQTVKDFKFEYLDHTADVQIHAWGVSISEALCQAALGMFNYMTPLEGIRDEGKTTVIKAQGHDLQSLLYKFLDEFLYVFHTELLVCRSIEVLEFDRKNWRLKASGSGEIFDRRRHECGTEVKAITYSAMQIIEKEGDAEVFVIVDI